VGKRGIRLRDYSWAEIATGDVGEWEPVDPGDPGLTGDIDEEFGETERFNSFDGGEEACGILVKDHQHNSQDIQKRSAYFSG